MTNQEVADILSALVRRGDKELLVSKEVYEAYQKWVVIRRGVPRPRSLRGEPLRYAGRTVRVAK